jgi:hypothetical protein
MSLSNYPPGVSGNEPQITGEWPCENCGATLPEEADCPECGKPMEVLDIKDDPEFPSRYVWKCNTPMGCEHESPGDSCPDGCAEPDYDAMNDVQREHDEEEN